MAEERDRVLRSGGCLCGAVRFQVSIVPSMHVCHCEKCRKWSGGAFMVVACDTPAFLYEARPARYVSSDWAEREFCPTCGSSLFWSMRDGSHRVVSAQSLDDMTGLTFDTQIFVDEKPSCYDFANVTTMMTGAEVLAAFTSDAGAEKRDC